MSNIDRIEAMNEAQDHLTVSDEQEYKAGDEVIWNGTQAVFIGYSKSHKSRCAIEYIKDFLSIIDTVFIEDLSKPETPEQKREREIEGIRSLLEKQTWQYSATELREIGVMAINGELVRVDNE